MKRRKSLGNEDAEGLRVFLLQKKREMEAVVAGVEERSRAEIRVLEDRLMTLSHEKKLQHDELSAMRELNASLQRELAAANDVRWGSETLSVQVTQLADELAGANLKMDRDQDILHQALSQLEDAEAEARLLHQQVKKPVLHTPVDPTPVFVSAEVHTRSTYAAIEADSRRCLTEVFLTGLDALHGMQFVIREQGLLGEELSGTRGELSRLTEVLRRQEADFDEKTVLLQTQLQQTEVLAQEEASLRGRQSIVLRELEQSVEEVSRLEGIIQQQAEELRRVRDTSPWRTLKAALLTTQTTLDSLREQFSTDVERLQSDVAARDEIIGILQSEVEGAKMRGGGWPQGCQSPEFI